jgi:ABC-2 type transport system ATP-binding protein
LEGIDWAVVGPLLGVVVAIDVLALVDLARNQVSTGPKWLWALLILGSFPLGIVLYVAVARRRPDEAPLDLATAPPPAVDVGAPAAADAVSRPAPDPTAAPVVRTDGLTKSYGEVEAVADVDLRVPPGSIFGLIGPNGAGKTTLLSLLTGLRRPTSGSLGVAVAPERVAVLPDTPQFEPWLTAREVVDLARTLQRPDLPPDRVDRALAEAGLAEAADRRVRGFSRGMLQRLGIACCLVTDPTLLLLDEPSSALDPAGRREVLDLVGRIAGGSTVVLSTHILSDVQQVCDVVAVLDHGRLRYQGPVADLLSRATSAVDLTVRPPADRLVATLEASPLVEEVLVRAPGQLRVVVADAAEAESVLVGLVAEAGARLVSYNPASDLEAAFLELTAPR